ncbi:MAG: NAD(+) synthase, partial [bacterium]
PELLPPSSSGEIEQSTEDVLGPYELHDFYLANFLRYGFSPEKMLYLTEFATFRNVYSMETRRKTLEMFIRRFFSQQFKRNCVPDGPKVGSVSLSPRGDWRMPSDAEAQIWLDSLSS